MLKRLSSLILALVIGSGVLAATARLNGEHVCKMADPEMMAGMETMPCCKQHELSSVVGGFNSHEECCLTIPQEPGSTASSFNLRLPSFTITLIHPAIVQSHITPSLPDEGSYATPPAFLPDLQGSYIRKLSLLI